jgi:predicted transcriptional regulator of viral defense system
VACAHSQYGLVTRSQLAELGLTKSSIARLIRRGVLQRVRRGVYRLLGSTRNREQDIVAALLWSGKESFASHRTAAEMHGLPVDSPSVIEITTRSSVRTPNLIVHRRASWPPGDVTAVDGIRVSTIPRTLLDLASVVRLGQLARSLDAALHRGSTLDSIHHRLEATAVRGRTGTTNLRTLIEERMNEGAAVESPLERDFFTFVRAREMPEPVAQYPVMIEGHVVARLDFAYPDLKIGIELDGYAFHSDREAFERDRRRLTELIILGWRILVFTRTQLKEHPSWVEQSVLKAHAQALAALDPR